MHRGANIFHKAKMGLRQISARKNFLTINAFGDIASPTSTRPAQTGSCKLATHNFARLDAFTLYKLTP